MQKPQSPETIQVLITSVILNVLGWIGLILLVNWTLPTLGPRWLFFFLVTLACSGLALPVIFFLHLRFPTTPKAGFGIFVREALFFSMFIDMMIWLQLGRVLTSLRAFFIAAGIIAIEYFLRLRERSKFSGTKND